MVPSLIVIGIGFDPLKNLVLSQFSLSCQLPFAMIPLILFTISRKIMGAFTNSRRTQAFAWISAGIVLTFNIMLWYQIYKS